MVTDRFRAQLAGNGSPQWVTKIEWSNNGGRTWQEAQLESGSCTNSQNSQIRWTAGVTISEAPWGIGGINGYHTRFKIKRGIRYSPWEKPELVGMGVYRCKTARRSSLQDGWIEMDGESFESYIQRSRFIEPRTLRTASARDMIENPRQEYGKRAGLITETLRDAQFDWDLAVDQDLPIPQLVAITDRWDTVAGGSNAKSIEQALAARIYPNGDGIWLVRPVATLQDVPAWVISEDPITGVSLGAQEELTSDGVYNVEVVTGTANGIMIGPGIAKDMEPSSPTYVGKAIDDGGFGEIAAPEYQSQMITSKAQCEKVAQARLAGRLGLRRSFSFGMLHDPTKRAGQVGLVRSFDTDNKVIIDSITFDLSDTPGPMQCQTRTQQTRLAGDLSEIPTVGEEGLDL